MAAIQKIYGSNLKISGLFHTVPLEWYSVAKPLYSSKLLRHINKTAQNVLKRKTLLATATIIVIIIQGILQTKFIKSTACQDPTLLMMIIFMLMASNCYVHFCKNEAKNIANLLNGLIQFDKMYPSKPRKFVNMSLEEMACVVMVKFAFFSGVVIPIGIVFGFHWKYPWKTSLAGYWLIPETNDQQNGALYKFVQTVCKLFVLLYNLWLWMFVVAAPVFVAGMLYTLSITILLGYIET